MKDENPKNHAEMLRDAGLRVTNQRLIILSVMGEEHGRRHPDAQEIFVRAIEQDASISLSTVYRTLKALEDSGAIQRHAFEGGAARFEPNDRAHHDHLIDLDTGKVIEFQSEKIEQLQREIAAELGYDIVEHKLEIYGRKRMP